MGACFLGNRPFLLLGILVFGILFYSGLTYPLIFKFGVEKGRIWFFATTILVSAGAGFLYSFSRKWGLQLDFSPVWFLVLAVILFIASAFLSVHFYKRREF
ncbi:MAG: ABC-2 transporter permease [Hydrogeniiclostridium mannosilyticum]